MCCSIDIVILVGWTDPNSAVSSGMCICIRTNGNLFTRYVKIGDRRWSGDQPFYGRQL